MTAQRFSLSFILVTLFFALPVQAAEISHYSTLEEAVAGLSESITEKGHLQNKKVLISDLNFIDAKTRMNLPLATVLRNKAITAMTRQGVDVILPGSDNEMDVMLLRGEWERKRENLYLTYQALGLFGEDRVIAAAEALVPMAALTAADLEPDIDSWSRYLVGKLVNSHSSSLASDVFMQPVAISGRKDPGELGEYFAHWLRPAMAASGMFRPSNDEKVDSRLEGKVYLHPDQVEVRLYLRDGQGAQRAAASAKVPKDLFPPDIFTPAKKPSPLSFQQLNYVYRHGKRGKFRALNQGDLLQSGDQYKVIFTPSEDAYVYIYQVDSNDQVFQLFPMKKFGRTVLNNLNPVRGGETYFLPNKSKAFYLDDQTGLERIYLIASREPKTELEALYRQLSKERKRKNREGVQSAQTMLQSMFTSRGMGGIEEEDDDEEEISWSQKGEVFSIIGKKLNNLCDGCVKILEFVHQ